MPAATTRITSRHNPIVARYRAAARGDDARVLLDGAHLVSEAVAAGIVVEHAAVADDAAAHGDLRELTGRLRDAGVEIVAVSGLVMDALSPVRSPGAIVAIAQRPADRADVYAGRDPLVVVACDVQDPGNLGAIVRVAEAGGASGVITTSGTADPFGWKALRGSMGSALRLPLQRVADAAVAAADARARGCRIVATTPHGGRSLFDLDLRQPTAVLIGGEGPGLPAPIVAAADERVTIPMRPPVESLNAAVTAALVVYEARRQRDRDVSVS